MTRKIFLFCLLGIGAVCTADALVTGSGWFILGLPLLVTALFCFAFSQTVRRCCRLDTLALSLGLSATAGAGLFCALEYLVIVAYNDAKKYPVALPCSIVGMLLCLAVFCVLGFAYIRARKKHWSPGGLAIDAVTAVIYLPAFFFLVAWLIQLLFRRR